MHKAQTILLLILYNDYKQFATFFTNCLLNFCLTCIKCCLPNKKAQYIVFFIDFASVKAAVFKSDSNRFNFFNLIFVKIPALALGK